MKKKQGNISGKEMKEYLERCWREMPAAIFRSKARWELEIQNDMVKSLRAYASKKKKRVMKAWRRK